MSKDEVAQTSGRVQLSFYNGFLHVYAEAEGPESEMLMRTLFERLNDGRVPNSGSEGCPRQEAAGL